MMKMDTKMLTTMSMLCGLAMILNILFHFPLVPAVSFLSYDPKDIVIVIGGFIYGPMACVGMSGICAILDIMFRGGNLIDVMMNMLATCSFCCVAAWIYKRNHTKRGAILGLGIGILVVTLVMVLWNYIVTPIYYQMPREVVSSLLLPGIVPFNLIKFGINAGVALLIYKPIVKALRSSNLVSAGQSSQELTRDMAIVGAIVVISLVMLVLSMQGII